MTRHPFDAHLCAEDPTAFQDGFNAAAPWVRWLAAPGEAEAIWQAIADSDGGAAWPLLGRLPYGAWPEGFALGVYGYVAQERL